LPITALKWSEFEVHNDLVHRPIPVPKPLNQTTFSSHCLDAR